MSIVFMSHVIGDAPLMGEAAQGLEAAGYTVWYFERDVLPGTSYLTQIAQAMDSCDAIILLVTPPALESDQVTKEVVGAFERGIPLFPVLVDVTPAELKERQPEWRHALGGTAMFTLGPNGLCEAVPRIIEGLVAKGIQPGEGWTGALTSAVSASSAPAPERTSERILVARSTMEGERKQVTVLHVGVVGLPLPSQELDPEEVHDLIQPAMGLAAEEIHRYEGTVTQLSSDGLTALFGAPLAHEDAPQRALYAALAIQKRLQGYAEELRSQGVQLEAGMGISTGLIIAERTGDDLAMEYAPIGDTVSLASSMESAAEPGTIQVAEDTYRLSKGYFDFEEAGGVEVRGRKKPAKSYRLLAALPARGRIPASLASKLSPFVGRKQELEQLVGCYQQAREGRGQVVGMVGEPGVGKSRLLLQFRRLLPEGDHTYLQGECNTFGDSVAYLPLLGIMRALLDIDEGGEEEVTREKLAVGMSGLDGPLDDLLPPLHELLSLRVEDHAYLALEPAQRREMVFEAIRHLLLSKSRERPLVLTVEDLQWIDRTSEEFLSYFISSLPTFNILLLLLYRPEYRPSWVSMGFYSQVRVDQLSKDTSAELIAALLPGGEVSPELRDFIVRRSAGNPLFIEELTRELQEAGLIERKNTVTYLLSGEPSGLQVPDTVQGIIASRLDRLEEDLKETLQAAAVIGREFSLRLLEAVTGRGKALKSCLHGLQSLEFIYEKSVFPETEYIFKHAFTQEVAYGSLLLKKRREMHEEIGRAIEGFYPDRLEDFYETLAHHYSRCDNAQKALTYLELSGNKAARSYSNWEAIRFYRESMEVLDKQPQTKERDRKKIDVSISIMDPLAFLGFPDGSIEILEEAETLAGLLGDEDDLARVRSKLAFCHCYRGNTALGLEYSEKCLEAAEKAGDIDSMAVTVFDLCFPMFYDGRLEDVAAATGRVLQLIEESHREEDIMMGGTTMYSSLLGWHAAALGFMGEFEEAERVVKEGLEHTLEVGDAFGTGWLETGCAFLSLLKGAAGETVEHARRAIERYEETGIRVLASQSWALLGRGHAMLGEHEEARKHAETAVERGREGGAAANQPFVLSTLAMVCLDAGDLEKAASSAEEALQLSRDHRSRLDEAYALLALGRAEAGVDTLRIERALRSIRQGTSMLEEMTGMPYLAFGHLCMGEVLEIAGQSEEARESLQKAEGMYGEMGVDPQSYWLTRAREALARLDR